MHRLPAMAGGYNPNDEGVIFIEQNPADIIFFTSADTDIQTLVFALNKLPDNFPDIRVANLLNLQQELTIDTYADEVLTKAKVIILRLLGGRSYWSYGLEVCKEISEQNNISLFILPGDDRPDIELINHSNVPLTHVNQLWQYLIEGGVDNFVNGFKFISNLYFKTDFQLESPQIIDRFGIYNQVSDAPPTKQSQQSKSLIKQPISVKNLTTNIDIAIIFYRSHYLSGNTQPIDSLINNLKDQNLTTIAIYVSSLRETDIQQQLTELLLKNQVKLILNTTSFSVAKIGDELNSQIWENINVPVLQVILSGSTEEYWQENLQGLSPRDVAMNVALPEVDGRIITRAISFKSVIKHHPQLQTDVVIYKSLLNRVNFIAELARNWVNLSTKPNQEKKIALILANYPNKDGRIANGVGLDTPASCINILRDLQKNGYRISDIPANGDELIFKLIEGITNDLEMRSQREINQYLTIEDYQKYFYSLPAEIQQQIINRWGDILNLSSNSPLKKGGWGGSKTLYNENEKGLNSTNIIPISGLQLDNIFIGIQPSRGYDLDPSLNYHAPDLEPTHNYLAFYYWVREIFKADAIIHVGKHGNLEWLPGKSLVLSETCYPEITLGKIPHFYPFIVNDPGEGSQAKRRASAVILDHLTPPLTRAELYKELLELEALIDEYYQAQSLNPTRLKTIENSITKLVNETNLNQDLGVNNLDNNNLAQFLTIADGYLCELKEAQIRDGLHIFGQCPTDKQLRDLIIAIARFSSYDKLGLIESIKTDLEIDIEINQDNLGDLLTNQQKEDINHKLNRFLKEESEINLRIKGDIIEYLEIIACQLIDKLLTVSNYQQIAIGKYTEKQLIWITNYLLPNLYKTEQEITNLIKGLNGKFIPSGASGAPTRGRADVLPTGRNFYSVDIRAIPTETAWLVGYKAAEAVIERYCQENGEYPRTLAISVWGTSTMRTGGDDIAQIMALMGVKPVWDGVSRRVVDYEIMPISVLNRPRIDVTVRVSGFFRDGFPNLMELLSKIMVHLSTLTEEKENNPLALQVEKDTKYWLDQGLEKNQAQQRATYRLFGSKPGAYGAGLQGLIESQNWQTDEDLARAYLNWSSYAYEGTKGVSMPEVFEQRLKDLQIVLHNQDNREHDILDSDDYYQFQGGLTVAVRHLQGKNPVTYFGDNSIPNNPRVRHLKEEIARVYRSRVINPKWIAGVMRHGYKGAFEMSATVDYLFAYSATTKSVPDFMFQGIAENYLFDEQVKDFIIKKNPWALRDIAERLIEANQRNLWQNPSPEILDKLRNIVHEAESLIE